MVLALAIPELPPGQIHHEQTMSTPSIERSQESKLLPKLSLKSILGLVTLGAFVAWLGRLAWLGYSLPWVLLVSLGSVLLFFLLGAVAFIIAWIPAKIMIRREELDQVEGSPFSKEQLPPQILPPRGP